MRVYLYILLLCLLPSAIKADEGMWLPYLMSDSQLELMQQKGLNIPFESIYSHSDPSLKDAVVSLDDGSCTAEFISAQGLLLTNHHCGYNEIQQHSSVDQNYLKDGFWAKNYQEELPNTGKTATLLIEAHDVTQRILKGMPHGIVGKERIAAIDSISTIITTEEEAKSNLDASIKAIFNGNKYILFLTETFKDVRLVGTPPSSIGKFGGDTDNWMWPRHTGDFCFFRVYCAPDGSPAEYALDNIPYSPKKHFKINLQGIEEGDFSMTLGYPGSTQRFLTSFGVKEIHNITNPIVSEVRGIKQNIWRNAMDACPDINIKYTAKYAESSNYWKYAIGQNASLDKRDLINEHQDREHTFQTWFEQDSTRRDKYGKTLSIIEASYLLGSKLTFAETIAQETMLEGADLILFALEITAAYMELEKYEKGSLSYNDKLEMTIKNINHLYNDFDAEIDQEVFQAMLNYYLTNIPESLRPPSEDLLGKKYFNDQSGFTKNLYQTTALTDANNIITLVKNGRQDQLFDDPAIAFSYQILSHLYQLLDIHEQLNRQNLDAQRLFINGLMHMQPNKDFYPDANSTLRLSYGTVGHYEPKDGVRYKFQTTLGGMLEKEDSKNADFKVPQQLKHFYDQKEFGEYALPNGQMPVCYLTNNDITGGNSGSPVINKNGELVGLAFDGNWEALTSDLAYDEKLQKCICVDIRYVLLIVDKMANAQNLIHEMDIIR